MTKSGQSELAEPIAIRPTSETGESKRFATIQAQPNRSPRVCCLTAMEGQLVHIIMTGNPVDTTESQR